MCLCHRRAQCVVHGRVCVRSGCGAGRGRRGPCLALLEGGERRETVIRDCGEGEFGRCCRCLECGPLGDPFHGLLARRCRDCVLVCPALRHVLDVVVPLCGADVPHGDLHLVAACHLIGAWCDRRCRCRCGCVRCDVLRRCGVVLVPGEAPAEPCEGFRHDTGLDEWECLKGCHCRCEGCRATNAQPCGGELQILRRTGDRYRPCATDRRVVLALCACGLEDPGPVGRRHCLVGAVPQRRNVPADAVRGDSRVVARRRGPRSAAERAQSAVAIGPDAAEVFPH